MEVTDGSGSGSNDNACCKECCGYLLAKLSDKKPKVVCLFLPPSSSPFLLPPLFIYRSAYHFYTPVLSSIAGFLDVSDSSACPNPSPPPQTIIPAAYPCPLSPVR